MEPMAEAEHLKRLREAGRNDPCPCGSGKKYKKCHLPRDQEAEHQSMLKAAEEAPAEVSSEPASELATPPTVKHRKSESGPRPEGVKGHRQVALPRKVGRS